MGSELVCYDVRVYIFYLDRFVSVWSVSLIIEMVLNEFVDYWVIFLED